MPDTEPDDRPQYQVQNPEQHSDLHAEHPCGAVEDTFKKVVEDCPWLVNNIPAIHPSDPTQIYAKAREGKTDDQQDISSSFFENTSPWTVDPIEGYQSVEKTHFGIREKHNDVMPGQITLIIDRQMRQIGDHVGRIGQKRDPGQTEYGQQKNIAFKTLG